MLGSQSIPASQLVQVSPNVLSAGGTALDIIGLCLTQNPQVPIGAPVSLASASDVADYFGAGSAEAAVAEIYFGGYVGQTESPDAILFAQYNTAAVAAYLRGGDASQITLPQLQALTGTLSVVMDGYAHSTGSTSLSSATSYSSAATLLQTAFNASLPTEATFTATIGATATGSGSGTNLTLTAVTGLVSVGDKVVGTGVPANTTIVSQTSGSTGGAGVYVTSNATTSSSASLTISSTVLNVTAVASGTLAIGQVVDGFGVNVPTSITAFIAGANGGIGTYRMSGAQQQVASESMTGVAPAITVTFDSVSDGFVIESSITGTQSSAAFATGSLAIPLLLTQATGAVLSQGATASTPAAFMTALTDITQNWVTFFSLFDPDGGSGIALKEAFANWTSQQGNQYAYVCWDQDPTPTENVPATGSLGYALQQNADSGTFLVYGNVTLAAFVSGMAAAINFNQPQGRITFAFRQQGGLVPSVISASVANNLKANGYNWYGGYATRNASFTFLYPGSVSGSFKWFDSYINQIWLNNNLQLAILTGLTNVGSVPYNSQGYALIEAFCTQPINDAIAFGAIRPGVTLSAAQITEVNQAAGVNIATTLQTRGWYLQVKDASPSVRAVRGSPPCTLWYTDGGSVQQIELDSIEIQ